MQCVTGTHRCVPGPTVLQTRVPCRTCAQMWYKPVQVSWSAKSRPHSCCHTEQDTKGDKRLTSSFSKATDNTYHWQLLTQILVLQGGSWDRMWQKEVRMALVSRWWGLTGGGSPRNTEYSKLWPGFSTADGDTWPAGFLPHFLGSSRCCSVCVSYCQWQSDFPSSWAHRGPLWR